MGDGGKGSRPRPFSVTQEEYDKRWDAIFQRDLDEKAIKEVSKLIAEETLDETESKNKKDSI
jgi:hypothetical protein